MPIYCELPLLGDVFEPLNTISNLAFLVAAFFVWRGAGMVASASAVRRQQFLAGLIGLVGVGSGLWHFFRTPWGVALDVLFINLFLLVFAWLLTRFVFSSRGWQWGAFAGFVAMSVVGNTALRTIDIPFFGEAGGTGYLLPLLYGLMIAPFVYKYQQQAGRYFLVTLLIFLLVLTTRQLDVPTCDLTHQHGLHLFWHIGTAWVCYRFAQLLVILENKN